MKIKKEVKIAEREIEKEVKKAGKRKYYLLWLIVVVIILGLGMIFYHFNENWSWLDSLYFSVTTLTTVGYGDLFPTTTASKIFTIFYIFIGLGIVFGFIMEMIKRERRRLDR